MFKYWVLIFRNVSNEMEIFFLCFECHLEEVISGAISWNVSKLIKILMIHRDRPRCTHWVHLIHLARKAYSLFCAIKMTHEFLTKQPPYTQLLEKEQQRAWMERNVPQTLDGWVHCGGYHSSTNITLRFDKQRESAVCWIRDFVRSAPWLSCIFFITSR